MDVLYFLKVLYRRKWIILGLSLLATIAAFLFLVRKQPFYESTAQYSTGFTAEKMKLSDGTSAIDIYTIDVKFDNVIATIRSPQVVNRVSYGLMIHDLADTSKAFTRLREKDKKETVYVEMDPAIALKILREKLAKNEFLLPDVPIEKRLLGYLKLYGYDYKSLMQYLAVNRVDRTDYLDISYYSTNPELAAEIVNKLGFEFLNYYKGLNSKRTNESAESIRSMMDNQQSKVDSLNKLLLNVKISQGSFDPQGRSASALETVSALETKLADEQGKYNEHSNRVSYLRQQMNVLTAGGTGGKNNNEDVVRLTRQKDELVKELARKGGNDPALQQRINDLRSEIVLKSNSGSSKIKNQDDVTELRRQINEEEALMNAAQSTIAAYKSSIRKYSGMTEVNSGSDVQMDVIRNQLEIENKQLVNVKDKYTQLQGLSKDDPTANFIQTRVGQPAPEPLSKKTLITMLLAGASVFFLTSILFIFLEIFDSSVKLPSIFSKLAKIRTAGLLNKVNFKKFAPMAIMTSHEKLSNSHELFRNNIRKIRYDMLESGKKVFLVSSTQPRTGKSSVVEAIAAGLVKSNKKVLIIDMNFSNNTLTERFDAKVFINEFEGQGRGLNQAQINQTKTNYEGLYIIGCKEINGTPSELLFNLNTGTLLEELKQQFDFIIIEGSALNDFADSKELTDFVDGVYLVFSAENGLTRLDHDSIKFVTTQNAKNQGAILNKVYSGNMKI